MATEDSAFSDDDNIDYYSIDIDGFRRVIQAIDEIIQATSPLQKPTRIIMDYEDVTIAWMDEDGSDFLQVDLAYTSGEMGYAQVQLTLPDDSSVHGIRQSRRVTMVAFCNGVEGLVHILSACLERDIDTLERIAEEHDTALHRRYLD